MHKEPPNYDEIELQMWAKNLRAVKNRLNKQDKDLLKRIETFLWRFKFRELDVLKKVYDDEMFAAHFAKEPRRTGFHEKIAAEWLNELESVTQFKVLPKSGKNAFYISKDGEIRRFDGKAPTKSLDFYWKTGTTDIYAYHKYTKEGGGNQDSQYKEMVDALSHFQGSDTQNKILIVIVDGQYYTAKRMDGLKRFLRDREPRSYACPIQDVPSILDTHPISI